MASMLWDIILSRESKHTWQIANETWVDHFGLVSIMACFAWAKKELDSELALIKVKEWIKNT
jgi:hypothetical protein